MNKKCLKLIMVIVILVIALFAMNTISNAATLSMSAPATVAPGETFSVTLTLNNGAGPVSASVSNGSGGYSNWLENGSATFSCTAGSSGSVTISASGTVGDFTTGNDESVSTSRTVTIKQPEPQPEQPTNNGGTTSSNGGSTTTKPNNNTTTTKPEETKKSSNSKLASLRIAEGIIAPEFDSEIREYTINVPNEITKLSIEAITDDSKATTRITGNEELQVGENTIEIIVTAENGSKTTYTITAIRLEEELNLQSLSVFYIDENGEKVFLDLEPLFGAGIYEYTLKDISYKIDKLLIEGIANKENATIDIIGNEQLKNGENEIKIVVTLKSEEEGGADEQKTYTIKVNKEAAPIPPAPLSTTQKMKNWFNGAGTWISDNLIKIQSVALSIASVALIGLTVYFIKDYKNYKILVEKLAEVNKTNLMEKANVALGTENVSKVENVEIVDEIKEPSKSELLEEFVKTAEMTEESKTKFGKGKRFR